MRKTTAAAKASLSAVAAVALAATLCMPLAMWGVDKAVAEETTAGDALTLSQGVQTLSCTGDGDEYSTIAEAIENGATEIVLTGNVTESVAIPAGRAVTLDLAGYTLTNVDGSHTITVEGSLTIVDSSANKTGVVDNVSHGKAALFNDEGATTVLNGGTLKRSKEAGTLEGNQSNGNSYYTILNKGDLTINEGTTVELLLADGKPAGYSSIIDNGWYSGAPTTEGGGAKLTINGGVIKGGKYLKNDSYGTLIINGGQILDGANASVLNWNVAEINGGTFDPSDGATGIIYNLKGGNPEQGRLVIGSGEFVTTGDQKVAFTDTSGSNVSNEIIISGGTFKGNAPDKKFLAEGYIILENADGTYTAHQHDLVEHPAKAATCTEDGNVDYWFCALCGNYYLSADSEKPVDVSAVVLSATGHQSVVHVDAVNATATEDGNVEYWYCKDCGRYFLDADLTEEASAEDVVIPATGAAADADDDTEGSNSNESGLPRTGDDSSTLAAMLLGTATLALCAGLLSRRVLG